ncbi:MAG: hypothetical protein ABWY78_02195 [Microvirga sp.]
MRAEAELRQEWVELDEALEVLTRRIALIGDHLRFGTAVADPRALEAARDEILRRMDRLMTRMRAVEGQLLQAGRSAWPGDGGAMVAPAHL